LVGINLTDIAPNTVISESAHPKSRTSSGSDIPEIFWQIHAMSKSMKEIYELSMRHEKAVLTSEECGCFYCLEIFASLEIEDWLDEPKIDSSPLERTAICPLCGIDCVLPQSNSYEITEKFLKAMQQKHFA
jgi:hypothetical protein